MQHMRYHQQFAICFCLVSFFLAVFCVLMNILPLRYNPSAMTEYMIYTKALHMLRQKQWLFFYHREYLLRPLSSTINLSFPSLALDHAPKHYTSPPFKYLQG